MAQILAIAIFIIMFVLIITEKLERHVVTLLSGILTLVLVFGIGMHSMDAVINTLNFKEIFTLDFWYHTGQATESSSGINWATIIFIAGMMIMVEGMGHVGYFRWLCMRIAKLVHYQTIPIFITFMIMSSILAMFIDSIT
ncbi:MAG: SLC13 family permease, partial [Lachnospiraceae bacterium]|nr:SLC13 family permease [Lachnospiraceae bacterium]